MPSSDDKVTAKTLDITMQDTWQRSPWLIRSGVIITLVTATIIMNDHLHYLASKCNISG